MGLHHNYPSSLPPSSPQNITSYIAPVTTPAGRRRLQQSLATVLQQITVVQTAQTSLQSQTQSLQASVSPPSPWPWEGNEATGPNICVFSLLVASGSPGCPHLLTSPFCCCCPLQVDRSNALAQARASDNTLVNLIDQGQASIASNQAAIMEQLAVIIGKQVSAGGGGEGLGWGGLLEESDV